MAAHIDDMAKESRKRDRHKRFSDAEKSSLCAHQDGRLPHNILAEIAKLKRKCNKFICARLVSKQDVPSFEERFGYMISIAVGKISSLSAAYRAISNNITSWKEIDKKNRTWIFLAAFHYNAPVTLQRIDVDTTVTEDHANNAEDEDAHVTICDASKAMDVTQHQYFMEDVDMSSCISSCIRRVDVTLDAYSTMRGTAVVRTHQPSKRLERKLLSLPRNVRHNFVWLACRGNMYSFSQFLAIIGQLPQHLVSRSVNNLIMKPHASAYHHPLGRHPDDVALHGVGMHIDNNSLRPMWSILAGDNFFCGHTRRE